MFLYTHKGSRRMRTAMRPARHLRICTDDQKRRQGRRGPQRTRNTITEFSGSQGHPKREIALMPETSAKLAIILLLQICLTLELGIFRAVSGQCLMITIAMVLLHGKKGKCLGCVLLERTVSKEQRT